jgi:ketosteroid isomerase-like protein
MSERVRGRAAIENSWRQIFSAGTQVQIRLSGIHRTRDSLLAIHVLHEHLTVPDTPRRTPTMIATNVYQLIEGSWHMVLHHASPVADSNADTLKNTPDKTPRKRNLH